MPEYKVLNDFQEKYHKNTLYKKGETYPKGPYKADPERVAFLQTDDNEYKTVFLGEEVKSKGKAKAEPKE